MNKVFDMPRIINELATYGYEQPWNFSGKWDIMDMARDYGIDSDGYSLENFCDYFGISTIGAHGALPDARMTAECFRRFEAIRQRVIDVMQLPPMQRYLNNVRGLP